LIYQLKLGYALAPAYNLISTVIVYPADDEDFALTLNGKKKKIRLADFIAAANTAKLDNKQ
jgi:serine/threonine-protein kinase HipA